MCGYSSRKTLLYTKCQIIYKQYQNPKQWFRGLNRYDCEHTLFGSNVLHSKSFITFINFTFSDFVELVGKLRWFYQLNNRLIFIHIYSYNILSWANFWKDYSTILCILRWTNKFHQLNVMPIIYFVCVEMHCAFWSSKVSINSISI